MLPPRTDQLVISSSKFPPYSTRAATQSLTVIDAATQLARTVNGALADLSDTAFRKFKSEISCTDMQAPYLAWPGTQVTVDCIEELSYLTADNNPLRAAVPGSSRVDGDYTFYRPRLTMRVVGYSINEDEWGAAVSWTLQLEEV